MRGFPAPDLRAVANDRGRRKTEAMEADQSDKKDLRKARRAGQKQNRVQVDLPLEMVHALDREARRLGVPRQVLIQAVIAKHLARQGPL